MMGVVYLTTAYLAPIEYYAHMLASDKVWVEQHDHYMKQTYRNRCIIAGPSGRIDLTVPTVKPDCLKCPTKDIRISDHGNWRHLHFEYIKEVDNGALDLREVIHPKHDYAMEDEVFKVVPYYQVFQEKLGFIPNLSIVDLLFNLGPESLLLLKQSINDVED